MTKKQPKVKDRPQTSKNPKFTERPEFDKERVLWSFLYFDHFSAWSENCSKVDEFCSVAKCMKDYEGRTWSEITTSGWRDHPVSFDRLVPEAQKRLMDLKLDDFDEYFRFRFSSLQRIWGVRKGPVFHVIWWDPEHRVCPSKK